VNLSLSSLFSKLHSFYRCLTSNSQTLTSIFSYPTHKLKIHPSSRQSNPESPATFLRSLFLPRSGQASSTFDPDDTSFHSHKRRPSLSRTSSSSHQPQSKIDRDSRSTSSPCLLSTPTVSEQPSASLSSPTLAISSPTLKYKRTESLPHSVPSANTFHIGVGSSNAASVSIIPDVLALPKALVVSGLEHASRLVQGTLVQVLDESRVVLEGINGGEDGRGRGLTRWEEEENEGPEDGVWNLPEGFIIVYVCPLDPRERPKIHKSLVSVCVGWT
jgi:hypothetical protein